MRIIFATRPSKLARWQTRFVIQALELAWPGLECQERVISTRGDKMLNQPLPELGGKGVFTHELETAILSNEVRAAVHSLKDLPIASPPGLVVGAVLARAEARDVLVCPGGFTLDTLPGSARVGTSSLRRTAQLLARRPDLNIQPVRGNVDTRLRKADAGEYDALVLAGAGLSRLGLEARISQWLPLEVMLPAPGQGALAVQCRADDEEMLRYLRPIEDLASRQATNAERAFLAELGGGCALPVGAHATWEHGQAYLQGVVASLDGNRLLRVQSHGEDPLELGVNLARQALANGAAEVLSTVKSETRQE